MTKECECAAHSAAECCCGAWDEPRREWVDLTRNDILEVVNAFYKNGASEREIAFARLISAKLKEKNA
jgi:hypothetical protein